MSDHQHIVELLLQLGSTVSVRGDSETAPDRAMGTVRISLSHKVEIHTRGLHEM